MYIIPIDNSEENNLMTPKLLTRDSGGIFVVILLQNTITEAYSTQGVLVSLASVCRKCLI